MNKVIMMGRLTKEPEVKEVGKDKKKISSIVLAVPRMSNKDDADFFTCLLWDKKAEVAEKYLSKGTRVLVEGYLQTDSYKDKEDATKYITRIIVTNLEFADNKKETSKETDTTDDLPF